MTPRAYIRIKDTAGAVRAVLTAAGQDGGENGFFWLTWKKRVNGVYVAQFEINQSNPDVGYATTDKYQCEIVRADPTIGLVEYTSFDGLIRDDKPYTDEQGRNRIVVTAFGANHLLTWRRIAYPANKPNYTVFTGQKGETILKRLVRDNCDPTFATTGNQRDRTPNTIGLTIATDLTRGNTINWTCGGRGKLLDELNKIALIAGGDFNVVRTGLATYQFEFYPNQLGTDRTTGANPIIFSLDRRNMLKPTLVRARSSEATAAIVGGKGQEDQRKIRVRTGVNYGITNDIETFVDGRDTNDNNTLDSLGDQALTAFKLRNALEFEVLQTGLYSVEQDYFLGDLALAKYFGITFTQQIYEVDFAYTGAVEVAHVVTRTR